MSDIKVDGFTVEEIVTVPFQASMVAARVAELIRIEKVPYPCVVKLTVVPYVQPEESK